MVITTCPPTRFRSEGRSLVCLHDPIYGFSTTNRYNGKNAEHEATIDVLRRIHSITDLSTIVDQPWWPDDNNRPNPLLKPSGDKISHGEEKNYESVQGTPVDIRKGLSAKEKKSLLEKITSESTITVSLVGWETPQPRDQLESAMWMRPAVRRSDDLVKEIQPPVEINPNDSPYWVYIIKWNVEGEMGDFSPDFHIHHSQGPEKAVDDSKEIKGSRRVESTEELVKIGGLDNWYQHSVALRLDKRKVWWSAWGVLSYAADHVLYIGSSSDLLRRMMVHAAHGNVGMHRIGTPKEVLGVVPAATEDEAKSTEMKLAKALTMFDWEREVIDLDDIPQYAHARK